MAEISFESYYGTSMFDELFLAHYGSKGQKWGIRRWQNSDGSLTPAGREHYGYIGSQSKFSGIKEEKQNIKDLKKQRSDLKKERSSEKTKIRAGRAASKSLKYDLKKTNSSIKSEKTNLKQAKIAKDKVAIKESSKQIKYYNVKIKSIKTSLKSYKLSEQVSKKKISELNTSIKDLGKRIVESKMRIKELKRNDSISHSDDYLMHHGVKGQKWYNRRYQNEDGSLTTLGRIHYGIGKGRKEAGAKELVDAYDAKKKAERAERRKEKILRDGTAKQILRNSDKFTTKELQEALQRVNTKQQLSKLVEPDEGLVSKITKKLDKYGKFVDTVATFKDKIDKAAKAFEDPNEAAERKLKEEIRIESEKSKAKALQNITNNDLAARLKEVTKKAREAAKENGASEAETERAVKLARDKFLSNVDKAGEGKKNEDYDSFVSKLAKNKDKKDKAESKAEDKKLASLGKKLSEMKKVSDEAIKAKNKEEAKSEQDSFMKKLSDVANQYETERNGARDSQEAFDRLKGIADEIRQDRIKRESASAIKSFTSNIDSYKPSKPQQSLDDAREASDRLSAINSEKRTQAASERFNRIVSTSESVSKAVGSGASAASSLLKSVASKVSTKASSFKSTSSSGESKWNDLSKSNKDLLDRSISDIMDDDKK